jgi:hypothetical protein
MLRDALPPLLPRNLDQPVFVEEALSPQPLLVGIFDSPIKQSPTMPLEPQRSNISKHSIDDVFPLSPISPAMTPPQVVKEQVTLEARNFTRIIACSDPDLQWIKVIGDTSMDGIFVKTTSVETEDFPTPIHNHPESSVSMSKMQRELEELKDLVGKLLVSRR